MEPVLSPELFGVKSYVKKHTRKTKNGGALKVPENDALSTHTRCFAYQAIVVSISFEGMVSATA